MKKTIAKIMAAAMVLSSLSVPQVANAAVYNGGQIQIANLKIGTTNLWVNGVDQNAEIPLEIDTTELAKIAASEDATYDPVDSSYTFAGEAGGDTFFNTAQVYIDGTGLTDAQIETISTTDADISAIAVTPGSSASAVTNRKAVTVTAGKAGDQDGIETLLKANYEGKAYKVNVNGEYNDLINADNTSNWVWFVRDNRGVVRPRFNPRDARTAEWIYKMASGAVLRVTAFVRNRNNQIIWRGTFRISARGVGQINDDYWNGIVKLKASNNRYTPIRVHVDTDSKALGGNNLGLFTQVVNRTNIQGIGWATGALTIESLANARLELLDVNENDLAILKSDYAKGKNLMLDKVYVFSTTDPWNDNGFYSAWTGYEDFFRLGVDTDLGTTAIGKIDKIHARLFKECKMKYVDAQNAKFINNGAFRKCKQLKKARIGDEKNMKKINEKAFYDCKKLATVKLSGKTLKRVGKDAFKKCKNNILFKIKGNNTQVKKAAKMLLKQAPSKARYAKI